MKRLSYWYKKFIFNNTKLSIIYIFLIKNLLTMETYTLMSGINCKEKLICCKRNFIFEMHL